MKRLVVVESPTKARTISKFLPKGFQVEASMGHVRDLPASASQIPAKLKSEKWARLGINVDDNFEPLYVIPSDKKKIVKKLKDALKDADELYVATDEDREGESIGWHLVNVLNTKIPVKRMVFHEITQEAILSALETTREINHNLVDAQETRRILDRLVGYSISPLLWKKIAPKLSAGRVQSVAVRITVMREKERIAFVPAGYFGINATLNQSGISFDATMTHLDGVRIAEGRDFDDQTGKLNTSLKEGKDVVILKGPKAEELASKIVKSDWNVTGVETRDERRSAKAPFITSTLQQEGSRKLGMSARQTMQVAQKLYEQGFITYMRTDSTHLSDEAITSSRKAVTERYGKEYLSKGSKQFANQVRNAQEAHEAIRPAGTAMKTKDELGLQGREGDLYDLIWKRTVASQMADAKLQFTTIRIETTSNGNTLLFRASGKKIVFPGFLRAYVEGSDDPEASLEDDEKLLPALAENDAPACQSADPMGHETKPPARYTEASLIKMLESEGIGRPSTYATIMDTIVKRGYVRKKGSQLIPTFTAFATNNLLEEQFDNLVDLGFTANMENILDEIATGQVKAKPYLSDFYCGEDGLLKKVEGGLDSIDAREISELDFPKWGPFIVRVGRYGPYVEVIKDGEPVRASLPDDIAPADVTEGYLKDLIEGASKGDAVLGIHPEQDVPVLLKKGPYGHYVQLGEDIEGTKPKRMSIPKGTEPENVTLPMALDLLSLPRELGTHPDTGKPILANIGRYGPYVQHERTFASLKDPDKVLTVGYDRAMELINQKAQKNLPLRELGLHPVSGEPVNILSGRYGPYVKHVKTNASLPKGKEIEDVTLEEALELIAGKEKSPPKKKTAKKKTAAKKKTTAKKKTAAKTTTTAKKKTAAKKKTTAKKTVRKKSD